MAKVLRIVTIERGLDPRDFTLVAFGGGGPLHACALAEELDIARVVVPAHPGLFSATGLLAAELHFNELRSVLREIAELDSEREERAFAASETRAHGALVEQGADAMTISFRREYDARYRGQSFELTIPYDRAASEVARHFHHAHRVRYGYDVPGEIVEIVNARLSACGTLRQGDTGRAAASTVCHPERSRAAAKSKGEVRDVRKRAIWIDGAFVEAPVLERARFPQEVVNGPAIVEAYDSTTYLPPRWSARADGELLVLARGAP
jgi:N-methylhydantoinase A